MFEMRIRSYILWNIELLSECFDLYLIRIDHFRCMMLHVSGKEDIFDTISFVHDPPLLFVHGDTNFCDVGMSMSEFSYRFATFDC